MTEFKQINAVALADPMMPPKSMGKVIIWIILIILIMVLVHHDYSHIKGINEGKKESDEAKWERLKRSAETYSNYHN